ncbi:hypothetical protein Ocin01_18312 [Orchesella cincta]|uniref:Uncharacterized protein n=1 Tax=Orchesella cincta TaxID=48709 RepID=A0A1D2M628_ORCCI|nr:hypothetical protein Ocin01_18312 [Orchesella cincta]
MDVNFQLRLRTHSADPNGGEHGTGDNAPDVDGRSDDTIHFGSLWSICWTLLWQLFLARTPGWRSPVCCGCSLLWAYQNGSSDQPEVCPWRLLSWGCLPLSIIFHCGLWIPAPSLGHSHQYFGIGPVDPPPKAAGSRLSKVTFAVPEAITKMFDVSPASPPSRPEDSDNMSPLARRVTRSSPKDLYTLPSLISLPAPEDFTAPRLPDLKVELVNDAARPGSKALKLDERDSISTVEMEMNQMLPSSQLICYPNYAVIARIN